MVSSADPGSDSAPQAPSSDELDDATPVNLKAAYEGSQVHEVLEQLDKELIGLRPVKTRIREIAALLVVERARKQVGLATGAPSLHMSFTGRPGTGKTTVAERMSQILHRLGYLRKGHVVTATRDDLVGQYIGHTAPKTREMLKKAMGGVLFIDEAYYLYRPENERDYGAEAIEILLQVMENNRDDLVVIFAGYKDRMDVFYQSNPGLSSRVANHIDFPDYSAEELLSIAKLILAAENYRFSDEANIAFADYILRRMQLPFFANARSIRNAIDRARMRQANRLFNHSGGGLTKRDLITIEANDIISSRVFQGRWRASIRASPSPADRLGGIVARPTDHLRLRESIWSRSRTCCTWRATAGSLASFFSTCSTAYITVLWSLPPKASPMRGRLKLVPWRIRYMPTWRAWLTARLRLLLSISSTFTP